MFMNICDMILMRRLHILYFNSFLADKQYNSLLLTLT